MTDSSVTIGSCTVLAGQSQKLGLEVITGASSYLDFINENGGVNGRKVQLVLRDDGFDPERAPGCFASLLKANVFATGFIVGNPTGQRYIELSAQNGLPIFGFLSGARQLYPAHNHYSFNVRASYFEEIKADFDALRQIGVTKIGVIYPSGPSDALAEVKAVLSTDGPELVAAAEYKRNTQEVDGAIQATRAGNPEAVILIGPYASLGEIIKRAHKQGWHPIFMALSFVGSDELISYAGADAENTVITQVVPPYYMRDLPTIALYQKCLKKYWPDAKPGFISLEGFIDAMILVEGLKRAGKDLTREKLIHGLESIHDLDVGLGPQFKVNYSPTNHKGTKAVYFTVVRSGTAVLFPDLMQAKIKK